MIYFIQDTATQSIKIGLSKKPKKRLGMLQTANPHKLLLLGTIPGTAVDEALLHSKFAEYRLHGEWFKGEIIESILDIISSSRTKVRGASMNGDVTTENVVGDDSLIQGVSQIPGLKIRSLSLDLRESEKTQHTVLCHVDVKYVLEFEEDTTPDDLRKLRQIFDAACQRPGSTHPERLLRHVFLDAENVVIPFDSALQCWLPMGEQSPITGVKGLGFRVLACGSKSFSKSPNRSVNPGDVWYYEGEHPLKNARKVVVHIRG
jgi:hypothetical protein